MLTSDMQILLVDAGLESGRSRKVLEQAGAGRLLHALSVEGALDLMDRGVAPDLVVVVADGGDAFRALRERAPGVPVLVVPELPRMAAGSAKNLIDASGAHASREVPDAVLDTLPAHIALLDQGGGIVCANEPWRRFFQAGGRTASEWGIGGNYLEACDQPVGVYGDDAARVAAGTRAVLRGAQREFFLEFPCHSSGGRRWFRLIAAPSLPGDPPPGVVVMHVDITERKLAELERKKLVRDLNERVKELRCLYRCALILQEHEKSIEDVLSEIVHLLPGTMQGDLMEARLSACGVAVQTPGFRETEWMIEARFQASDGREGLLQVCRTAPPVDPMEPSFLPEERDLLESLADMLRGDIERRAALASLKEREEQFRLLFEQNPHPMWVFDSETLDFLSVNSRAVAKYGYSREEFLSMNVMDIRSGEEAERLRKHLAAESKGVRDSKVWSHRLKSGAVIQVEVTSREMEFAGRPARLVLLVDVTRRLEAEAALRAGEARLRTILDTEPECVQVVSLDGCLQEVNASGLRMFGADGLDQIRGRRFVELIDAEYREAYESLHRKAAAGGTGQLQYRIVDLKGASRWVETHATPLRDGGGEIESVLGVTRDITESRHAEAMAQASDERFRLLARAANDAIWDWDRETDRIWWNEGMEKLFGYSEPDIEPTLEWRAKLLHPEDRDRVVSCMTGLVEGGGDSWSHEYRFLCKSGKYAHVLDRGHVIRDASGKSVRMIGSMADVTERKHLEQQLFQTQKMNAIGLLAGGVAHDFNNLLCVINGYSDLLMTMMDPDDGRRTMLSEIRDAGERAASLTRQLLAFSRKQVLAPKILDLNEVVSNIERMVGRLLGEDIRMSTVLDPSIPSIRVDRGQLEQVVINLAVNARDAMPKGGRLTVESKRVKLKAADVAGKPDVKPGTYVALLVSDTGCGIPKDILPQIFEPFFTTKELGKGTGLGLSTVFGIVRQSEGFIDVHSEAGLGTCFKILFPAVDEGSAAAGTRETAAEGGSETVLLVEDEAGVRGIARMALESLGYRVLEASHGSFAIERAREEGGRIDVLVTDVVMPEMGGRELVQALREIVPGLRVVYMSGYTDDAVVRHGIIDASEDFLQKPFQPLMLARKVREVLDR